MQQESLRSALLTNKLPSSSTKIQQQSQQQQQQSLQDQQYSRHNSQGMLRNESGLSFHVEGENISQTIEMHEMMTPNDNNQFYEHNPSLLTPQQNYKNNNNSLNASAGLLYQSNYTNKNTPLTSTQAIYTFLSSVFFSFGAYLTENVSQGQVSVLEIMFYRSLGIILCLFILYKISQYVNHSDESDNPIHRHGAGNGFKDIAYIQPRERKYVQILSTVSALVVFCQFYALEQLHLDQAYTLLNIPMIFTFLVLYLCSPESLANSITSPRQMDQSEIVPNYNVITFSSNSNNNSANKQDNFIFQSDSKINNASKNDKDQQPLGEKNAPMIVSAFTPTQQKINKVDSVILPAQPTNNNNNQTQSANENSLTIPQQYSTVIQDKPRQKSTGTAGQFISLGFMTLGAGIVAYLSYTQSFTATVLSILGGSGITGAVQAMASSKSWNTPLSTLLFYGSFVQLLLSPLLIAVLGQFHGLNIKEFTQIFLMAVSQIAGTKCLQLASLAGAAYQPAISIVLCVGIQYFLHVEQKMLSLAGIALVVATIVFLAKTRGAA